jgi:hypothetical protein
MACSALQLISTQRATLDPIFERMCEQDLAAGALDGRRQRVLPALDPAPRAVAERCPEQASPVRPGSPLFHALAHRPIYHHSNTTHFQAPRPGLDGLGMVRELLQSENTEQRRVLARGGHCVFDGARKSRIPFAALLCDFDHARRQVCPTHVSVLE